MAKTKKKEVDLRMMNHDFLRDFIRMWRERPVLWDKKHEKYLSDGARFTAYVDLHEKLMEVDKNATIETVKNKIQGMRSVFRRELRRLETAEKSGKEYIIRLWYFPELLFLTDKEIPQAVLDKINSENDIDLKYDEKSDTVLNNPLRSEESVKKFISLYRTHECLWNLKSTNYYNRTVKLKALENLRKKLAETEQNLSIELIKIKINSLRTCFLRELKKVKDARKKGAAYNPTLFYFNDLLFLIKDDLERWGFEELPDSTSDFKEFESINFKDFYKSSPEHNSENRDKEQIDSEDDDNLEHVSKKVKIEDDEVSIELFSNKSDDSWQPNNEFGNDDEEQSGSESKISDDLKYIQEKRKKKPRKSKAVKKDKQLEENTKISKNKEDEVDSYAKYVACELKLLSDEDRTFVKKVFNDALFEAKVGNAKCMRLISNTRLQLKLKK